MERSVFPPDGAEREVRVQGIPTNHAGDGKVRFCLVGTLFVFVERCLTKQLLYWLFLLQFLLQILWLRS